MKRFMMVGVLLGGLMTAAAPSAKADHYYGGGRSGFGISINYGNGYNNFGGGYSRGYGYGSPYGGGYGGYRGGYRRYNHYPVYSVPVYRGGYGHGGYGGYGGYHGHGHCH